MFYYERFILCQTVKYLRKITPYLLCGTSREKNSNILYINALNISLNASVFLIGELFILIIRRKHKLSNFILMKYIKYIS